MHIVHSNKNTSSGFINLRRWIPLAPRGPRGPRGPYGPFGASSAGKAKGVTSRGKGKVLPLLKCFQCWIRTGKAYLGEIITRKTNNK